MVIGIALGLASLLLQRFTYKQLTAVIAVRRVVFANVNLHEPGSCSQCTPTIPQRLIA